MLIILLWEHSSEKCLFIEMWKRIKNSVIIIEISLDWGLVIKVNSTILIESHWNQTNKASFLNIMEGKYNNDSQDTQNKIETENPKCNYCGKSFATKYAKAVLKQHITISRKIQVFIYILVEKFLHSNTGYLQFLFVKLLSACQNDRMIVIRQICSINSGDSLISWLLLIHYWIPVSTKTYQFKSLYKTFYWQCVITRNYEKIIVS